MALIDDNVAEIVFRVMGQQEISVGLVAVAIQRPIGGDEDACILLRVAARDGGGISAEHVLESRQCLAAEFVAIANKKGATQLPCIGDALEQIHGNEGFLRRWPEIAVHASHRGRSFRGQHG